MPESLAPFFLLSLFLWLSRHSGPHRWRCSGFQDAEASVAQRLLRGSRCRTAGAGGLWPRHAPFAADTGQALGCASVGQEEKAECR